MLRLYEVRQPLKVTDRVCDVQWWRFGWLWLTNVRMFVFGVYWKYNVVAKVCLSLTCEIALLSQYAVVSEARFGY